MDYRITADEVSEIIDTAQSTDTIYACIAAANSIVTSMLGASALVEVQLREIERWLAAHFLACSRERQLKVETVGQAKQEFLGKADMGLDATLYGQQVKLLDTTGILSMKLGRRGAGLYAIPQFEDTI